jgi:dTMP kinase
LLGVWSGLDAGSATLPVVSPTQASARGLFLTIEGPEGAGKTTVAERLEHLAQRAGLDPLLTREPGGTSLGERVRDVVLAATESGGHDPRTDALLFNAARAELVRRVIDPALDAGRLVICTRFADSTVAYQGHGAGLPVDELRAIERFATGGLRPDRTLVLDLPAQVGLARKLGADRTRFETEFDLDFHQRVRAGYLAMALSEPARFRVVDASTDPDRVLADVLAAITDLPGLARLVRGGTSEPQRVVERIHP